VQQKSLGQAEGDKRCCLSGTRVVLGRDGLLLLADGELLCSSERAVFGPCRICFMQKRVARTSKDIDAKATSDAIFRAGITYHCNSNSITFTSKGAIVV
jgi:hypothetical protein